VSPLYVVVPSRPVPWVERLVSRLRARCTVQEFSAASGTADTLYVLVGDERGGIAAFGETLAGRETIDVRLAERGVRGIRQLRFGRFSYAARYAPTLARVADRCAEWIAQELRERNAGSPVILWLGGAREYSSARPAEQALFTGREIVRWTRDAFRRAFLESRSDVAVARASLDTLLARGRDAGLRWIARDENEHLGDPFLASSGGRTRLLCNAAQHGARTTLVAIDLGTNERAPLATGTATSYPNTFRVAGEQWLAPDRPRERRMHAYRLNGKATSKRRSRLSDRRD
jgi:hypothetical protein